MPSKKFLNELEKKFRELSPEKQKNFLEHLYSFSSENADMFNVWILQDEEKVVENSLKKIEKETLSRIGRYRKMRAAKINEVLRQTKKYPLSLFASLQIYQFTWESVAQFICTSRYVPNAYRASCVKYVSEYLDMLKSIAEPQERTEREKQCQEKIWEIISSGAYFPHLEDFYLERFGNKQS